MLFRSVLRSYYRFFQIMESRDIALPEGTRKAVFGLGCFWAPDGQFPGLNGVLRTAVGYAGGKTPNPTYAAIMDHTEVIEVEYDPNVVSYNDLLENFWKFHDASLLMKKRQYISLILYGTDNEKHLAEASKAKQKHAVTEIRKLEHFYLAEGYHQKYHLQHAKDVMTTFGLRADTVTHSCIAAKLSAFVMGFGSQRELEFIKNEYSPNEKQLNLLLQLLASGGRGSHC